MELACDGNRIAIIRQTGEFRSCYETPCRECLFHSCDTEQCKEKVREWAESEYIEKSVIVISKKDRAFLEYLGKELKYIAREAGGNLMAYECNVSKGESGWIYDCGAIKSFFRLNVQFPMVKWEDSKPWLIEDLKGVEVVDSYE